MSIAPGNFMQEIADFSLLYPEQLEFDYWQTGDLTMLRRFLPVAEGIIGFFSRFEDDHGLLANVDESWNLVDWPVGMRDGYDFSIDSGKPPGRGSHAVLNMMYYGARQCVSRLRGALGLEPLDNDPLRATITQAFFDEAQGCFVDAIRSTHASLHSNVMALYCGIIDSSNAEAVWRLLERKRMACGPHMAYFCYMHCSAQADPTSPLT